MRNSFKVGIVVALVSSMIAGTAAVAMAQEGNGPRFKGPGIEIVMDFLDVSKGNVISTLRSGGTLAELAEENGSSGDALVEVLVAEVDGILQQAVDEGRITEEEAAERLADAQERITRFVFSTHDGPDPHSKKGKGVALNVVMETLDVNRGQVISTLRSGGTLAELAEDNGSTGEVLVAALVAQVDSWLQQAVDAGRITAEEAADRLADAEQRITTFVFSTHNGPRAGANSSGIAAA